MEDHWAREGPGGHAHPRLPRGHHHTLRWSLLSRGTPTRPGPPPPPVKEKDMAAPGLALSSQGSRSSKPGRGRCRGSGAGRAPFPHWVH